MKVIAHRGLWKSESEKNTIPALKSALECGYGIETDIRDYCGEIVISHDPANAEAPKLTELLRIYTALDSDTPIALNIKSDGLYALIPELPKTAFLFDASIPEQYVYIKRGFNIFTRSSEFEPEPAFFEQSRGVWLDQFTDCRHIFSVLEKMLACGKTVCIVSPELHGRDERLLWEHVRKYKGSENLYICTDKPEEAEVYFR